MFTMKFIQRVVTNVFWGQQFGEEVYNLIWRRSSSIAWAAEDCFYRAIRYGYVSVSVSIPVSITSRTSIKTLTPQEI